MNILLIAAVSGFVPEFEMKDVRTLRELGFEVHYASNFDNPVYEFDIKELEGAGVKCHHIPIRKSPFAVRDNMRAFMQVKRLIEELDIKAIHCHNPVGGLIGRTARIGTGCKPYCIYTAHGFHFYEGAPKKNWMFFYPVERLLARFTDRLICINREDEKRAEGFRLRKNGRVVRIPGVGTDQERFRPRPGERYRLRERLGLGADDFIFISAGELNKNKNHTEALEAFSRTDNESAAYIICGEGPERENLEKKIRERGLEGKAKLLGYRSDLADIFCAADCFVFPSLREGLGMAAVEAMACGLPVIAAANRGSREYEGEGAVLYEAGDVGKLSEYMNRIMKEGEMRKKMGTAAEKTAEMFSAEKTESIMREVYEDMTEAVMRGRAK